MKPFIEGILYRISSTSLSIAVKEMVEEDSIKAPLTVVMLPNDVTHKRCTMAMQRMQQPDLGESTRLRNVLMGIDPPYF